MMFRQLKQFNVLHERLPGDIRLEFAGSGPASDADHRPFGESKAVAKLPRRPDASVISATIPLFYIGRNKNGLWVVREAEGRCGGLFLRKRSALRFARAESEPAGCAMMFIAEPFELDVENRGSRFAGPVSAAVEDAARSVPLLVTFIGMAVAEWRNLVAQVSRALAGERRNREAIEKELFRGHYTLSSKSDDDLPIVL